MKKITLMIFALITMAGADAFAQTGNEGYFCQLTTLGTCTNGRYSLATFSFDPREAISTCINLAMARRSPICRVAFWGAGQPSIYSDPNVPTSNPYQTYPQPQPQPQPQTGYYCQLTKDTCTNGRYSFPTWTNDPRLAISICMQESQNRGDPACRVAYPYPGAPAIWSRP